MMNVRLNNISINCMLAALLSALFASCTNEIEDEADPLSGKNEKGTISFSTYTGGATRAADVTALVLQGKEPGRTGGFQVSAWYNGSLYLNDQALFQNGLAGKVDDAFDTKNDTYYWPTLSADKKIGFRAFNTESGAVWTDDQCKWIRFNIKTKAADQKDLVVAYADAVAKPANGVQPLNFMHALSKINFSFVGVDNDLTYTINKVEVIAAGDKVDLANNHQDPVLNFREKSTSLQNTDEKFFWNNFDPVVSTSPLINKYDGASPAQGVLYTYYDGEGVEASQMEDQNLMLLPQSGRVAIRVYYKVEDGSDLKGNCGFYETDKDGSHNETNDPSFNGVRGCKTLIIDFGSDKDDNNNTISGWEAGKSYRYTLALPTDNYLGDADDDGVPDMKDDTTDPSNIVDLDGDGDKHDSEFGMDDGEWIEFSVSFTAWESISHETNIIIK